MARSFTLPAGEADYDFTTQLNGVEYGFRMRWNSRDASWYMDLVDADDEPIVSGVRLVLGAKLGARSTHPFFDGNILYVYDTSNTAAEAGIDDLGKRVSLIWSPIGDIAEGG